MYCPWKKEEKKSSPLKGLLIALGIIIAVAAAVAIMYKLFKKYFRITLECGDLDSCDCDELSDCEGMEPECFYADEDVASDSDDAADGE